MKTIAQGALGRRIFLTFVLGALIGALTARAGAQSPYEGAAPEAVTIRDYFGDAMEPFVSRDGRLLFFNTRTTGSEQSDLLVATRLNARTFRSLGPVRGANSPALDAVASMDRYGMLYFVSTRAYADTFNTLYAGRYRDGGVRSLTPVAGLASAQSGRVHFDAEISADGRSLYFVDGLFIGRALPWEADLALGRRYGAARFARDARSTDIFARLNTGALEYAPAISADEREIFFTRMTRLPFPFAQPSIWRATRNDPTAPFETPTRLPLAGFVEAPSIAPDGSVYFHRREEGQYRIYRLPRAPTR